MSRFSMFRKPLVVAAIASAAVIIAAFTPPLVARAVDPTQWTTTINPISRDSYGNPINVEFTMSGPSTTYAICVKMTSWPAYNTKAPNYSSITYTTGGVTYQPCVKFSWGSKTTNTHHWGHYFPFGGPGTYEVHWYVPDTPANGGTEVGQGASGQAPTFTWANSDGTLSPCPPDPQLQVGVWRPSRFQILNRCKTMTGSVTRGVQLSSQDYDKGWKIGSSSLQVEYVKRDWYYDGGYLPLPAYGSTWTITGVYVCDLYHGHYEMHPVFQAKDSSGNTSLSGPQYSVATPSVSGTWSTHNC